MMSKKQKEQWLRVSTLLAETPEGMSIQALLDALAALDISTKEADSNTVAPPRRTLQSWLKKWVEEGLLSKTGTRRDSRYFLSHSAQPAPNNERSMTAALKLSAQQEPPQKAFPFSTTSLDCIKEINKPTIQRKPEGYNYDFLNHYRPNSSAYLSASEQAHLTQLSKTHDSGPLPAGTFARQLLHRLLIDLSWNSSRLEGNTYSLLDTRRLIQFGAAAEGKASIEAQMILNHKEAIEFLVGAADDIGFNRYTLLNLHALLADNLLDNPDASGCLRKIPVSIGKSVFQPLEVPQRIEACFEQILATASAIQNPFEQALFALVQLPYLQAFDDVNKRVSRLAANIPFIKHNLMPLTFADLPQDIYTDAILCVYELNRVEPLKEIFIWAYERSINHYQVARQTLGEPDAFRIRYRQELKTLVSEVVRNLLTKQQAYAHIKRWVNNAIPEADQQQFLEYTETELLGLHEGNFARYQLRPSEFNQWQNKWVDKKAPNA